MRITRNQLGLLVDHVNQQFGLFLTIDAHLLARDGGENTYRIIEPIQDGSSAVRDVSPRMLVGECYTWVRAYMAGLERGRDIGRDINNRGNWTRETIKVRFPNVIKLLKHSMIATDSEAASTLLAHIQGRDYGCEASNQSGMNPTKWVQLATNTKSREHMRFCLRGCK